MGDGVGTPSSQSSSGEEMNHSESGSPVGDLPERIPPLYLNRLENPPVSICPHCPEWVCVSPPITVPEAGAQPSLAYPRHPGRSHHVKGEGVEAGQRALRCWAPCLPAPHPPAGAREDNYLLQIIPKEQIELARQWFRPSGPLLRCSLLHFRR